MEEEVKPSVAQTEEESTDLDTVEDVVESEESTESVEELKERLKKAEEIGNNYKIRAEKAERKGKETKVETKVETKESELSSKDTIALIKANVHEDDVDEVLEYARFRKIPVSEALKSPIIKATLTEKEELRNTANATNTGRTRSGSSKPSGNALLEKAKKTGELPDSDDGLAALVAERYKK